MTCEKCGAEVDQGLSKCPSCAAALTGQLGGPGSSNANAVANRSQGAPRSPMKSTPKRHMVIIGVVVGVLIAASVGFFVYAGLSPALNSSDANRTAVRLLKQSRAAANALGEITDVGWPYGELQPAFATLYMSVKGTRASGHYFASLKKADGEWVLVSGRLELRDGTSINISAQPAPHPSK